MKKECRLIIPNITKHLVNTPFDLPDAYVLNICNSNNDIILNLDDTISQSWDNVECTTMGLFV